MNDRTRVYIDGFSLYYGCLQGRPFRWLDVADFYWRGLPNNDITLLRYFTAPVIPRPNKPRGRATKRPQSDRLSKLAASEAN